MIQQLHQLPPSGLVFECEPDVVIKTGSHDTVDNYASSTGSNQIM